MKAGIVVFPGTNCDIDTKRACEFFGWETSFIWHDETDLSGYDVVFLPGGFSYGDYIRAGRLAKFSPVMQGVKDYVESQRGFVVGICNGFQILCETKLLPGILSTNKNTKFICEEVLLSVNHKDYLRMRHSEPTAKGWRVEESHSLQKKQILKQVQDDDIKTIKLPIAHGEGRYIADEQTLAKIQAKDMIFLQYQNNPNGSVLNIAGLYDKEKKVIGMMPHPERGVFEETGNTDGRFFFEMLEKEIKNDQYLTA